MATATPGAGRDVPQLSSTLAAVLSAPRHRTLETLSHEISPVLVHTSAVMLTGACARAPMKSSGEPVAFSPTELLALADRASQCAGIWTGQAEFVGIPRYLTVLHAGEPLAGGAALVLLNPAPVDLEPQIRSYLTELWNVVTIALADRAADAAPSFASSSAQATRDRVALVARSHEQQTTLLVAMLAALRSKRLDDTAARHAATQIASDALTQHRHDIDVENTLVTQSAKEAWDNTITFSKSLLRHGDIAFDCHCSGENLDIPLDVAHLATSLTRAVIVRMTDDPQVGRIKLRWDITASDVNISLRDNGAGEWKRHGTAELDAQLAPYQSHAGVDSNEGWGTIVTISIPLALPVTPTGDVAISRLTEQELAILTDVAAGMRNRDIAAHLALSEHTVKFHVRKLLRKFSTNTRGELAAKAHRLGV